MDDQRDKLDDLLDDYYWKAYDVGFEKADGRSGDEEDDVATAQRREINALLDTILNKLGEK